MAEPSERGGTEDLSFCFHGSYTRSVDAKGRFNLPFRFRRSGGPTEDERYVVAEGPQQVLTLLPYSEWLEAFKRLRQRKPSERIRDELRRLSVNSRVVEPDSQGRIMVPLAFLERAEIQGKVLVVGLGNQLELWAPDKLEQKQASMPSPDKDFMSEFFG